MIKPSRSLWSKSPAVPAGQRRRLASGVVTVAAVAAVDAIAGGLERTMGRPDWWTGGVVAGCLIVLTALGLRRRLPLLRTGSMATWTQVHLYVGLFSIAAYAMHVPAIVGRGPLEAVLSIVFLLVAGSGLYGLHASRTLPRRLTAVPGEHRFCQVQWHREQIRELAGREIDSLPGNEVSHLLRDHYFQKVSPFFETPPRGVSLWWPRPGRRRRLLAGLSELGRYLDDDSRAAAGRLAGLVRLRDDLDYRHALMWRLRSWVVVHSATTLLLIGLAIVHVWSAFRAGS